MHKPCVYILAALFLLPTCLTAQPERGSVDLLAGIGAVSGDQINTYLSEERGPITISHSSGINFVSGKYFLSNRVALGLTIAIQHISGESNDYWTNANSSRSPFSYQMTTLAICPELTLAYVNTRHFVFYGMLGLGYDHYFVNYTYSPYYVGSDHYQIIPIDLNVQVTPIGLRFGNALAGFLEIGYGYKGLLNTGVAYSLRTTKRQKQSKAME